MDMESVEVYTDGSGCAEGSGYGAVLIRKESFAPLIYSGYIGRERSSTLVELNAFIRGLWFAEKHSRNITIYTDSKYISNRINKEMEEFEWWDGKTIASLAVYDPAAASVKNEIHESWVEINKLLKRNSVKTFWVRGHAGNDWNELADYLARQGALGKQGFLAVIIDGNLHFVDEFCYKKYMDSMERKLTRFPLIRAATIDGAKCEICKKRLTHDKRKCGFQQKTA